MKPASEVTEPRSPDRAALLRRLREELTKLALAVDATKRDAGFTAALGAMALLWRYSPFNQWVIALEDRKATRVAGRRAWAKLGRTVKPDAKRIYIFAPWSAVRPFPCIAVVVYDVRHTLGKRLPKLDALLHGHTTGDVVLLRAAENLGIRVVEGVDRRCAGMSIGGEIRAHPGLDSAARASVLAHELGHELLHQTERLRAARAKRKPPPRSHAEREAEAEATSFVVLRALGLSSKAPRYIAWQGGDGTMILAALGRIQRAARRILAAAGLDAMVPWHTPTKSSAKETANQPFRVSKQEPLAPWKDSRAPGKRCRSRRARICAAIPHRRGVGLRESGALYCPEAELHSRGEVSEKSHGSKLSGKAETGPF